MGVKSELSGKSDYFKYPCLVISPYGNVWLMYDNTRGTLVHVGDSSTKLGVYVNYLDINDMKPFYGSITLSSE